MLITIAGDDVKFCDQLLGLLTAQNHRVSLAPTAGAVLEGLKAQPPQLLVLVQPAGKDSGAALLRSIRDNPALRTLPILCVNPRGGSADGVDALDAGADDFINRPFNPQIFLARVRTLLRRGIWTGDLQEEPVTALQSGALSLQLVSRQALLNGAALALTRLEFDLLAFLMRHEEEVFKRQDLLEAIWNYPDNVETRTLDKHIETLRRKLGGFASAIQTVHGIGYRFLPLAAAKK